jgi:multidrug efflux pump
MRPCWVPGNWWGPLIAMTITLAAVYAPIGLQGGLTGSLFREFAFTLAGAVTISGVVALTLSPMMSSKLLTPGMSERGFAGKISRASNASPLLRPSAGQDPGCPSGGIRGLDRGQPAGHSHVYHVAQGAGPHRGPGGHLRHPRSAANSTLDQNSRYAEAVNDAFMSVPETEFTFQVTFPNSGFGGMVVKPWEEREATVFELVPEVQQMLSHHSGPSACSR